MLTEYTYDLTLDDYKAAQWTHMRHHPSALRRYIFWIWVMPAISAVCLILLLRDTIFHHFSYPAWLGGVLCGAAWLGLANLAARPFKLRRGYRNIFPEGGWMGRPIQIGLDGEHLISRIPGRSEGRFLRTAIVDYAEDDKLMLLYLRSKLFLIVPKRALPSGQWPELQKWLGWG